MIKLVATDIDGTIFIPEKEFTCGVKECISKLDSAGIKVVLVTGRMNAAATKIAQDLGLNTPVVSYQGGLVVENGKKLYERYLTEEQTGRILDWAAKENIHINLYNDDLLYSESECYEVQRYCNNLHTEYNVKKFSEIKKDKINKLLAIDYSNPERISRYEKELQDIFPDSVLEAAPLGWFRSQRKESRIQDILRVDLCANKAFQNSAFLIWISVRLLA